MTTAAVKAGPIQLRPHASAQRAVMTVATSCLDHADANQPHLGIDDPEVLHQFRVAYRRLRSLFSARP
ncbi:MAG: CHAD domain-containing protein [Dermatophilaceae bacterium]